MTRRTSYGIEDLAGVAEIAVILDVTTAAVSNWPKRYTDFPAPLKELAMGPLYSLREVTTWYRAWKDYTRKI